MTDQTVMAVNPAPEASPWILLAALAAAYDGTADPANQLLKFRPLSNVSTAKPQAAGYGVRFAWRLRQPPAQRIRPLAEWITPTDTYRQRPMRRG
jgi:hypothetical protein